MTAIEQRAYEAIIKMAHKDEPDYWTRLEHQYAGMIVQGMVEHNGINFLNDAILNVAVQKAHALVGKMKGERK
jgi:hypothetical protein